ncbi:MAG TPA: WYL domain-containing transcriptional regulator [Polyangiaceae bacterium]|nr:WYL domain-containing transcriptional regulator [Polyangiaceae bacterium]
MAREERARRVARLVGVLGNAGKGCTIQQIVRTTKSSRATVYRDLELLREAGYAVQRVDTVNGEARYALAVSALAARAMTPHELAALALGRRALASVEGSQLVRELDAMLARAGDVSAEAPGVELALPALAHHPDVLRVLHEGVTQKRTLRIRYRGAKDEEGRDRVVHPVTLQVVDQQPYLIAWDELRRALRTFKVARVARAKLLRSKARATDEKPGDGRAKAVKVWSSEPVDVRIRIAKPVARFLAEWPLVPNQAVERGPDGTVDVCARVYGLEETLRWILRWGVHAEALEPAALRQRVREELAGALAAYQKVAAPGRGFR